LSSTLEHRLYFKKSKKFQNSNTWFFGQRFTYLYVQSNSYNWHYLPLNFNAGRNHCITERLGISWDAGFFIVLLEKQFDNQDGKEIIDDAPLNNYPRIGANLRLQIFYRL
jgi:hypothetical protein